MPMLNAAAYLPEALESVLQQTTDALWELLVVDDGSEDNSLALARSALPRFAGRLRLLQHADRRNHGTSASRNLALAHARGEFTAFLDADDVWQPEMLTSQLSLLRRYPEAALAYANAERTWQMDLPCAGEDEPQGVNELPPLLPPGVAAGLLPCPSALPWFLNDETVVPCTCTVLARTAVLRAAGGFEELFQGLYDDQALYAKVMLRHPVAVSTRCVARYRRHYDSCCARVWHDRAAQTAARQQFLAWLDAYKSAMQETEQGVLAGV